MGVSSVYNFIFHWPQGTYHNLIIIQLWTFLKNVFCCTTVTFFYYFPAFLCVGSRMDLYFFLLLRIEIAFLTSLSLTNDASIFPA